MFNPIEASLNPVALPFISEAHSLLLLLLTWACAATTLGGNKRLGLSFHLYKKKYVWVVMLDNVWILQWFLLSWFKVLVSIIDSRDLEPYLCWHLGLLIDDSGKCTTFERRKFKITLKIWCVSPSCLSAIQFDNLFLKCLYMTTRIKFSSLSLGNFESAKS